MACSFRLLLSSLLTLNEEKRSLFLQILSRYLTYYVGKVGVY